MIAEFEKLRNNGSVTLKSSLIRPMPVEGLRPIYTLSAHKMGRVAVITPDQAQAARALLGWTCDHLSKLSGVGVRSIERFERCDGITRSYTVAALRVTLETAGVKFTNGREPRVKLRKAEL